MASRLFGTDGVRGVANRGALTPDRVMHLALAAARVLRNGGHRHRVLIAKDTRLSGYMLENALTAGFLAAGMDVRLVGPMPTPAVAMLVKSLRADLGVMISASHNAFHDNGIKLFGPDGYKLSDEAEAAITDAIDSDLNDQLAEPELIGRARRLEDAPGRYIEYVKGTFPRAIDLTGMKLVVDCAHGAAWRLAERVFSELGADVVTLGTAPNGMNINDGVGAVATQAMQDAVVAEQADLGIALDGDADRVVLADQTGARIDGDQILALIARAWATSGRLARPGVVATVMSNLGLERFLTSRGLSLVRTPVGDRHVVERMRSDGYAVGGEQSGHIILNEYSTTGDGLIAALQVLAILRTADRGANEVLQVFEPVPQTLRNVRFDADAGDPMGREGYDTAIAEAEAVLGSGRLLVRKSGTEPLVRIMAEGDDPAAVEAAIRVMEQFLAP